MPVIVLDADGTIYIHTNQKAAYLKALGKDYSEERESYKRTAMEIGDPSFLNQRVFFALISRKEPHEAIKEAYERRKVFREEILKEIEPSEIVSILPEIFNRYPVLVASNDTKDFLLDKLAKVGALPYIHHIYTASDFGVLKPHDAFFNRLREEIEEHYGHTRMIFVDDLDVNVEAARRNGFEAYKPEEFVRLYREGKLI